MATHSSLSRRTFCLAAAGAAAGLAAPRAALAWTAPQEKKRLKVAAVFTELRFRSHAYNILINFLGSYLFRGRMVEPGMDVVSFYADQFPENDMARDVAERYQIRLCPTIADALTLGGSKLAVDAVLLIGEHGDYPFNELRQHQYPRKEFFDQIVEVMRNSNQAAPIFNDKHLSYRWDWAKQMYDTARELRIPLMAGSSVPLAVRQPALELPAGAEVTEAVSVHGGGLESYDFHGLELLQSLLERRRGDETGIARVQLLAGAAYQEALQQGRWSQELVEAALRAEQQANFRRQPYPQPTATTAGAAAAASSERLVGHHALLVTYQDGTPGTVLAIGDSSSRWDFACRLADRPQPLATALYNGPWGNRNLFNALSYSIQHFFRTGEAPYPVERTLLVTGALDAAMHSHHAGGQVVETPHLVFPYATPDWSAFREDGSSWKKLTVDSPQPTTFAPDALH